MDQLACWEKLFLSVLKKGIIPRHIAFIMDGNRRYARKKTLPLYQGHEAGLQALKKCLLYCTQLDIKIASFYCFSIQNFDRKKEQVDKLMELVVRVFEKASGMPQMLQKHNIKVMIVGDSSRLYPNARDSLLKIQQMTAGNSKMLINLCFAYDGLWQIRKARETYREVKGKAESQQEDLWPFLQIKDPVDVTVRTSDENRLSNFMLMQQKHSYICILKESWPQLNILSFMRVLLEYAFHQKAIKSQKKR